MGFNGAETSTLSCVEYTPHPFERSLQRHMSGGDASRGLERRTRRADKVVGDLEVFARRVALDESLQCVGPSFDTVADDVMTDSPRIDEAERRHLLGVVKMHGVADAAPREEQKHGLAEDVQVVHQTERTVVHALVVCEDRWP